MANPNPSPRTRFKRGEIRNPRGGKAHNPAIRALKKLTIRTYREVIELVLTGNMAALEAMIEAPNTPAIQVGVATAFQKAIERGDYGVIERIAERIVGKIPDELSIGSRHAVSMKIDSQKIKDILEEIENEI